MQDSRDSTSAPLADLAASLPPSLKIVLLPEQSVPDTQVLVITLARAHKRNALDDTTVLGLAAVFEALPSTVRAVVLEGEGEHFSAGLDLSELSERDIAAGIAHSRLWHRIFREHPVRPGACHCRIEGRCHWWRRLELACAAHLRVAETSAYYALPEGQRGIFVGGGGSVRLPRLIGVSRMTT